MFGPHARVLDAFRISERAQGNGRTWDGVHFFQEQQAVEWGWVMAAWKEKQRHAGSEFNCQTAEQPAPIANQPNQIARW